MVWKSCLLSSENMHFTPYPKQFSLQILKFEENLFIWKRKLKSYAF